MSRTGVYQVTNRINGINRVKVCNRLRWVEKLEGIQVSCCLEGELGYCYGEVQRSFTEEDTWERAKAVTIGGQAKPPKQ